MSPEAYLERELPRFREELFEFLRIPSVSAREENRADTARAARWLHEQLLEIGLEAEVAPTAGHPVVVGQWMEAGPSAPTILVYGHYDVQPPEPMEEWTTPPFEPGVRDGRIYARGATDDKGQLFLHLKALECFLATDGRLPVNLVALFEGEEEVGSPNLLPFVEERRERLTADAVVISDSNMFAPGLPSLLFSLRGLAYFEITVQGPTGDLHSGSFGGAVENPANALARILASLHDEGGRIAIDGFYDDVVEWDQGTREALGALPFDEEEYRASLGVAALGGEKGYTPLERTWIRPSCDVNGIVGGYTGEGAKTVLPSRARAKVSFRLVPDQHPERVAELLRRHLRQATPPGVRSEMQVLHGGLPWRAELEGPFLEAARNALEVGFGRRPVLTGEGGTIPIVRDLEELLGAQVVLLGFGLPGSNMHAPNEWFPDAHVESGIRTLVHFYREAGRLGPSG